MCVKNLALLPIYFYYSFVHLKQKVRLRPELSSTFLSTLGPNPNRKARPDLQLCVTLPISMLRFKNIIFYQNSPKIKLFFAKKIQNFRTLRALPPDLRAFGGAPRPPN